MEKRKASLRETLTAAVFIAVIGVFFILNLAVPAPEVLVSERRTPAKFPELSVKTILSGAFMGNFDDYAADHFVFRDGFRSIRAFMVLDVFLQSDKSGIYRDKEVGLGEFRKMDETAFRQTAEKIKKAAASLEDVNVYYSIVPDKSIFAGRYMPGFDLEKAEGILSGALGGYTYIPLAGTLGADSFYKTDLHWNQPKIGDKSGGVVNRLLSSMGRDPDMAVRGEKVAGRFRGVYAGQLALPADADGMGYFDVSGRAYYLNEKTLQLEEGPVYDFERFSGIDPYDFFLRGPQPLIVLENTAGDPGRELYLFRDSFGSSLAPLMLGAYSRITLIDLRYLNLQILGQFVDFTPGSDALFIYSSQIFNNPSVLQVH
ncbi:MAG: hypothetical protein LBH95_03865 [Oscillospiraceae bacterium]|jgi:hypothetical protein|nr:hypothetical protein [Oscillospiraceae bacterium]